MPARKNETTTQPQPELLRPTDAARLISVSRRYLGKLTAANLIPVHRIGKRCIRYSRADVLAAVANFRR